VQLPIAFDPAAKCPGWDQFIADVFPGDSEAVAWEVANEEEISDARAMKPTVNAVARNLRMIYTLFCGRT